MTKVRCIKCGNVQDAWGRWFFSCNSCGEKQIIENSIYEPEQKQTEPETPTLEQNQDQKVEVSHSPSTSNNQDETETLEIEEPETENKTEVFRCPVCNNEVEEFKDCENCGHELIWSEE